MSARNDKLDAIVAAASADIAVHWESCRRVGMEAMTVENTAAVDAQIRGYFDRLKALPDPATDAQVLAEMERVYAGLDKINAAAGYGLLETDERELLVPLFVDAAAACGVAPDAHDGEPGGEYRNF